MGLGMYKGCFDFWSSFVPIDEIEEVCWTVNLYNSGQKNIDYSKNEERLKLGTRKKYYKVRAMEFSIKGYYRCWDNIYQALNKSFASLILSLSEVFKKLGICSGWFRYSLV